MYDLLLRALRCEAVPRPPVWLMRQAGRYMPQYRALRQKHSLWEMFHDPQLAAAVTLMPVNEFHVDAAILFSDILVIAEALGLNLQFPEGKSPRVEPAVHTAAQVEALPLLPVEETLSYVYQTISLLKKKLSVPLIGFCGGPFTVASYLIDSHSAQAFERTKRWMIEDPRSFHLLLEKITQATIAHLRKQIEAGADVVQIFDSWANVLDDQAFSIFSIPYLQKIVEALKSTSVPVILFCRDSSLRVDPLAALKPAAISFDWHQPLLTLRQKTPLPIAIQGNFNPDLLKRSPLEIAAEVSKELETMRGQKGFIVNLGHGVTPDIPIENVRTFINEVIEK